MTEGAAATFSDYVFERLRADILTGQFEPLARLAMKELSERYQVGTSPVREALHRLTGEGFVQFVGQRGFRVPPLSLEDLDDLTDLRSLIEEAALRQAMVNGDDAWEAGIVAAFHRLERRASRFATQDEELIREYDAIHRSFHLALFASAASPRLVSLQANLFDQAYRYRTLLHQEPITPRDVVAEHKRLMKLVLARDVDGAVKAMKAHLQLTRAPARRRLQRDAEH